MSTSIYLLKEQRVDAYVAVNVLIYFVTYAIIRPVVEPSIYTRLLNVVLFLLFIVITAYRIYEVVFE